MSKVFLALSGGVDSSVALSFLKNEGHNVEALCLKMSALHDKTLSAAEKAAAHLSVPLHIVNAEELFESVVVKNFAEEYLSGRTPNPCIVCNPAVKFRLLYDFAVKNGFDKIATGHYATIRNINGKNYIGVAANIKKDQSYMLYRLPSEIIDRLIFPLGETKDKSVVRDAAVKENLPSAENPDSQEICFIENETYADFIERNFSKSKKGCFIGPKGEVLGEHKGIMHYTVGQRKGLSLSYSEPIYVKKIDSESGNVFLCRSGEEYFSGVRLKGVFLPHPIEKTEFKANVKIRYSAKTSEAEIKLSGDTAEVIFKEPQRACCPGQSAVFYSGDIVIGGGFISENI